MLHYCCFWYCSWVCFLLLICLGSSLRAQLARNAQNRVRTEKMENVIEMQENLKSEMQKVAAAHLVPAC